MVIGIGASSTSRRFGDAIYCDDALVVCSDTQESNRGAKRTLRDARLAGHDAGVEGVSVAVITAFTSGKRGWP